MDPTHPINQALLTLLDNQAARTVAAMEELPQEVYQADPGRDCHSIRAIGEHLIGLQRFQLRLLESPLAEQVPSAQEAATIAGLRSALDRGAGLLRRAIGEHDPDDWFRPPPSPRQGPWGDEPTLARWSRPFNDLTNHLGAIRAIRRILACPAPRAQ